MKKLLILIAVLSLPGLAWAEGKVFLRDYTYQASEADSKITSRSVAIEQVRRMLLEEIGTYIESRTEVKNFELAKDQITALTAGIVQLKIVDQKWDGEKYWLKAEMVVDPGDVAKKIDAMRQDRVRVQELEESKKRIEDLLKENEMLRKTASKSDLVSVQRYQENVKSLETAEMIREAQVLISGGQLKKALEVANGAVAMEPQNPRTFGMRGYVYLKMTKYADAIRDFSKTIELNPKSAPAYFHRGGSHAAIHETEKAIGDFSKCIDLKPKPVLISYAHFNRGIAYGKLNETDKAIKDYSEAIVLNPRFGNAYHNRGLAYSRQKKFDEAIRDFNQAAELDANNEKIFLSRAMAYNRQGRTQEAFKDVGQAMALNPQHANAYWVRGRISLKQKKPSEALRDFNQAIQLDADLASAYFDRALVYGRMGMKGRAETDMQKAAALGEPRAKKFLKKQQKDMDINTEVE